MKIGLACAPAGFVYKEHLIIDYTEDLGRFGSYKSDGSFTRRGIKKGIKCFANIRFPEF